MTGVQLATFTEELNGGDSIGETLLFQLLNLAKGLVEQRRPWMDLRYTDVSKTVSASTNAWNTSIDISDIARFSRFYGKHAVKVFDGTNRIDRYIQKPFNQRLDYREAPFTFIHDVAGKKIYLNGSVSAGTLWLDHIKNSADLANDTAEWIFPSWSHSILGFVAVGIHKGGIDYDEINARMAPDNRAQADAIMSMLETRDNELQLAAVEESDPSGRDEDGWRPNAINM